MRTRYLAAFGALVVAAGCTALDTPDLFLEETDGGTEGGGGGSDGSSAQEDGNTTDPDTGTCVADFATDTKHCGRCFHDCLGGTCKAGVCGEVRLASPVYTPTSVAVDNGYVYATLKYGEAVVRVSKIAGGAVQTVAADQTQPFGLSFDGTTLYWSNAYFKYNPASPNPDYKGGVWKCDVGGTLPPAGCTPTLVVPLDYGQDVHFRNGMLYVNEANEAWVRRVQPDGGGLVTIRNSNQPTYLAVDDAHVYFNSNETNFGRVQLDGGGYQAIAPLPTNSTGDLGQIALDDDKVYWAVRDTDGGGRVTAADKANVAGGRVSYGPNPTGAIALVVDAANVYWSQVGTYDATNDVNNSDGKIVYCPKAGCPASGPIELASKLVYPMALAQDDVGLYWVEYGADATGASGAIKKIAKP